MKLKLRDEIVHIATGGRDHKKDVPFLVLLHGSGNCHLTWQSQSRSLAYDGFNVIAPDFPGHYLSGGKALSSIEEQAKWLIELLGTLGADEAIVAGHSQGALVGLETARQAPKTVSALMLIGAASAIPVNDHLIKMAQKDERAAIAAMTDWGHGPVAHMHDNSWPGASMITGGQEIMSLNPVGSLAADLKACAAYDGGEAAAKSVACPALCVLAQKDRMTPVKSGKAMAGMIKHSQTHILANCGHMIPLEKPAELNALMRNFLTQTTSKAAA